MIQPALERQQAVVEVARAFGKDDQRITGLEGLEHRLQGVVSGVAGVPVDQDTVEYLVDDVAPQPALLPVIGSRHRPRAPAQVRWQRGPQQHEIPMATVVGIVDALR
ncbi:hypothetical protein D9M73_275410 [compost metagenome]